MHIFLFEVEVVFSNKNILDNKCFFIELGRTPNRLTLLISICRLNTPLMLSDLYLSIDNTLHLP